MGQTRHKGPVSAAARFSLDHICQSYFDLGGPPSDLPSSKEALRELLASSSVYSNDRQDVQSYTEAKVAWPEVGSVPVSTRDMLSLSDSAWFDDWKRSMLRSPEESRRARISSGIHSVHNDP